MSEDSAEQRAAAAGEAIKPGVVEATAPAMEVRGPENPASARWSGGIVQFAVKAAIVGIVVYACAVFIAESILGSIDDAIHSVRIGGPPFWEKIERELDRAADPSSDLPPEKKQKIINDLRVIVARWKPVIDAITGDIGKPAPAATPPSSSPPQQ